MVFSDEGLRHLVAEAGVGQIVYGTDVPFNWPVTVDLVLERDVPQRRREGSDPQHESDEAAADQLAMERA